MDQRVYLDPLRNLRFDIEMHHVTEVDLPIPVSNLNHSATNKSHTHWPSETWKEKTHGTITQDHHVRNRFYR